MSSELVQEIEQHYRMPAEWEEHRATWVAWPTLESDFPGKLETVRWVYTEIVRHLSLSERVEILCRDEQVLAEAKWMLDAAGIKGDYEFHQLPYHRSWLRDSAGTAVFGPRGLLWVKWLFNAWAKYHDFATDQKTAEGIAELSGKCCITARRPDNGEPLVLEGGAIETNGQGVLLVTEQCLLSEVQERNPGLSRQGYEQAFKEYLGVDKVLWLAGSCEGDDTHGHIDDVARFVNQNTVLVSCCDKDDPDYGMFERNYEVLRSAVDFNNGSRLEVVKLPAPSPLYFRDEGELLRLPASYANFYIANSVVLVPTFNDVRDREALGLISEFFPERKVVGIHAVDYVLGYGTLHCSTQQEPLFQR